MTGQDMSGSSGLGQSSTFGKGGIWGGSSPFTNFHPGSGGLVSGNFATGGDFITTGPRIIQVGESGPERVTITPLSDSKSGNLGLNLETSVASKQLDDLIRKIENSPVKIPIKLDLDIDSYNLQVLITEAVKVAVASIRVR